MEEKLSLLFDFFLEKSFEKEIDTESETLLFYKKENDTRKCISIGYKEIGKNIRLDCAVTEYIEISKVEELLEKVTSKKTYFHYTVLGVTGVEKGGYLSDKHHLIKNDKDLKKYIQLLDGYYNNHISPFFDAVPTLQSFNDNVLNIVPFDDYRNYLSGEVGLKAMIIMYLCKNPLYEKYVLYREKGFQNSPNLHDTTSPYHKIVKQSFEDFNRFKEMVEKNRR